MIVYIAKLKRTFTFLVLKQENNKAIKNNLLNKINVIIAKIY